MNKLRKKIDDLISERFLKVVVITVLIIVLALVLYRTVDEYNKQEKIDDYIGEMQESETDWKH